MSQRCAITREVVSIPVGQPCACRLHGVLTSPVAPPSPRRLVIFSQAGLQSKSGVGDYFRWLGDELARRGYDVLRFDQRGTGDSPGEIMEDTPLEEYFLAVQAGVSTEDTLAALRWSRERLPGARYFLWGQCGGCIPSLEAAAQEPDQVAGLLLLALPVLYSRPLNEVRDGDARLAGKGYLHKLLQPRSYLRLLSGKSEYHLIEGTVRSALRRARRRIEDQVERLRPSTIPDHPLFNDHLWEAFQAVMARPIPTLVLMASIDNETPEFDAEFRVKVLDRRRAWQRACDVQYIPEADHSLMLLEARQRSLEMMLQWLARRS